MLRNGYWFNLETREWEARRFPPSMDIVADPNALFTFRGAPTFFGGTVCDEDGYCEYREVQQYDSDQDLWITIGSMMESRSLHEASTRSFICMHPKNHFSLLSDLIGIAVLFYNGDFFLF